MSTQTPYLARGSRDNADYDNDGADRDAGRGYRERRWRLGRERCLAAAMDDYVAKPIEKRDLRDVLHHWIQDRGSLAPPTEPVVPATMCVLARFATYPDQ